MSKSVLILSASLRNNSNSDLLAEEFSRGVGCGGTGSIRNQPELLKTAHDMCSVIA